MRLYKSGRVADNRGTEVDSTQPMNESNQSPQVREALSRAVREHKEQLEERIREVLLELAFENRYTLHPRRLAQYSKQEIDTFLDFLENDTQEPAETRGRRLAREGFGEHTLVALASTIEKYCLSDLVHKKASTILTAMEFVDRYREAYLSGYLLEREDQTLKDQEQLRKALSAVLERQSRELRIRNYAINTTINGILISDLSGTVTYINAAFLRMWGYERAEEALGANVSSFWEGTRAQEVFRRLPDSGGWHGELTALRKDYATFEVELSASVIRDESGNALGLMASFIDITESKRFRNRLFQRQKMEALGELAGGIAHDFNNLLAAVTGYVQLLLVDAEPDSQLYNDLIQVKTAVDRGADLTKQLRYFTRKASGIRKVIDVNELIKETFDLVKRTFPLDISIETALESSIWSIEADPSQISQILMNLCVNARDAIMNGELRPAFAGSGEESAERERNGVVQIVSENVALNERQASRLLEGRAGRYVRVRVKDNGIGMSQDVAEKLFEPFFTTKELGSGSGLGLAVVYGIVHNHNGFIAVQSEVGRGSTFDIYLPAVEKDLPEPEQWKPPETSRHRRGDILVIDDDRQVAEVLNRALRRWGYTAAVFRDPRGALEYFRRQHTEIDLVILDMLMPKMNGREFYARLREVDPDVKVIVITGYTSEMRSGDPIMTGIAATVEKPLDLTSFATVVEEVLQAPPGS